MIRPLLAALLLALPAPAQAWWDYGHATIARIAWAHLTPTARVRAERLMRLGSRLGTPECPVSTPATLAYWADCIKPLKDAAGQNRFGYAYNWHFENVDICKPFDLTAACKDGDCVSAQVTRQAARLADRRLPQVERLRALAFLVHFVGDLHQPMHAGDRGDRGGNDVKASYGEVAGRLNLHMVWDGYLAERAITSPPGERALAAMSPATRRALAAGSITEWAREGWRVAHDAAYVTALGDPCGPVPERAAIDNAEIIALVPVVRLEMRRGGARLAKLLNRALG